MSTEPGNTGNASAANRGATDGGPLRDRSERTAADDAARTVAGDSHRTNDTATGGIGADSAADPAQGSGRHTGNHAGSHLAEPVAGSADGDARAVPTTDEARTIPETKHARTGAVPVEDTHTRTVPAAEGDDTRSRVAPAADDTRTRAVPADDTHTRAVPVEDTRTRAVPATDADDTRTRVAPVTSTRDLPDESDSRDGRHRTETLRHETARDEAVHTETLHNDAVVGEAALPNREALLAREKERFGGMKFGSAFFGWLTATGMVVLLSALAAAIGAAVGLSAETDLGAALESAAANQSAGIIGAVIMLAVLLLSYYAGGYVAGRMARFNGLKQGLAVWLWALIAAAVVVILGLIYGSDIRSISQLNSVAPLPEDLEGVSAGTWIAVAASLVVTLIGAVLGGLAGMRFHRRIDRADFRTEETVR